MNIRLEQSVAERTNSLQQANETLVQKNAELENLNSDLSSFAFVASHDLSEPLRKIRTFASLLVERESSSLTPRGKELIDKINTSAERMKLLIEEILAYSHTQQVPARMETVDLNDILGHVKSDLYSLILEKNAAIDYKDLPFILCYPLQISRLFQNILSNSIKFCPPDRVPRIKISAALVKGSFLQHPMAHADRKYLKIAIKDNGIGFDPQYNEKIFQMFQRLHSQHDYPGTGMGLAICKKIMENHQGFMMTDSTLGAGATFCCYFPQEKLVSEL
jgi:light-regulated signal transduction histidine kinase (bacteriophytochrome)